MGTTIHGCQVVQFLTDSQLFYRVDDNQFPYSPFCNPFYLFSVVLIRNINRPYQTIFRDVQFRYHTVLVQMLKFFVTFRKKNHIANSNMPTVVKPLRPRY